MSSIGHRFGEAGILCCLSGHRYDEILPNGVRVLGMDANPDRRAREVVAQIARYDPTHLVVNGPMPALIRWGIRNRRQTACIFADSFNRGAVHRLLRYGRIAALLNAPRVQWVANHGRNACRSLIRIGVSPDKVIAWDWVHDDPPEAHPPRRYPGEQPKTLLFVGSLHETKGVGDVIDAIALLRKGGSQIRLAIAGAGMLDQFRERAFRRGVAEAVDFLGIISNQEVAERMRQAFAVVIPSRHEFPEGLPLTIYEALRARTPIIASDHPMFSGHLIDGRSAMVFPAGNVSVLAEQITALCDDQSLYEALSKAAPESWARMQIDVKWGDLLHHWLADQPEDRAWLKAARFSMAGEA